MFLYLTALSLTHIYNPGWPSLPDRAWGYHLCLGLVSCVIVTKKMCFVWKDDELSFLELTHCLCLSTPRDPKKSMSLNGEEGSVSMRAV